MCSFENYDRITKRNIEYNIVVITSINDVEFYKIAYENIQLFNTRNRLRKLKLIKRKKKNYKNSIYLKNFVDLSFFTNLLSIKNITISLSIYNFLIFNIVFNINISTNINVANNFIVFTTHTID